MRHLAVLFLAAAAAPAFADGDVSASMTGSTLVLVGDAGANEIVLTTGGATGAVTVSPAGDTLLNGVAAAVTFEGVRHLRAAMGEGDDRLDLDHLRLRGGVRVRLEDGDDSVAFLGTTIRGRTRVACGAGVDAVRTDSGALFLGTLVVRGETGNDDLRIVNGDFRQRVRLDAGGGDDHVLLQGIVCSDTARAEVVTARGFDVVEVVSCRFSHDLVVETGPADDRLRIAATRFEHDVEAFGGPGGLDVLALEPGNQFLRLTAYGDFEEGQPR